MPNQHFGIVILYENQVVGNQSLQSGSHRTNLYSCVQAYLWESRCRNNPIIWYL